MTNSQRLTIRASEIRQRLNEIAGLEGDALTDEVRAEETTLQTEYRDTETKLRAAIASDPEPVETRHADSPEGRELRALIDRADCGEVYASALEKRASTGPTLELQQHYGLGPNQVPLALLEGVTRTEHRAVTPAPADVGANQAAIIPYVFPMGVAEFMGVDMPTVGAGEAVFPVLTTAPTVGTPAENAAQAETTGSFSADLLAPGRLQAAFFYSREDRARFAGMGEALSLALSDGLSDGLDRVIVAGDNGLLTGTNLANHAASAVTTFDNYMARLAYGRVDGRYAGTAGDIRVVMGSGTYAHAGSVYRNNSVDRTALDRLMEVTGGVRVSAHVPAVVGKKQNAIVRRGMRRDMVAAVWDGVTLIPDEVTKADKGQILITAVMLHAVKLLRSDGFYKQQTQHP